MNFKAYIALNEILNPEWLYEITARLLLNTIVGALNKCHFSAIASISSEGERPPSEK